MSIITRILIILILFIIIGGLATFAVSDFSPPTKHFEIVIPNDRFSR